MCHPIVFLFKMCFNLTMSGSVALIMLTLYYMLVFDSFVFIFFYFLKIQRSHVKLRHDHILAYLLFFLNISLNFSRKKPVT